MNLLAAMLHLKDLRGFGCCLNTTRHRSGKACVADVLACLLLQPRLVACSIKYALLRW